MSRNWVSANLYNPGGGAKARPWRNAFRQCGISISGTVALDAHGWVASGQSPTGASVNYNLPVGPYPAGIYTVRGRGKCSALRFDDRTAARIATTIGLPAEGDGKWRLTFASAGVVGEDSYAVQVQAFDDPADPIRDLEFYYPGDQHDQGYGQFRAAYVEQHVDQSALRGLDWFWINVFWPTTLAAYGTRDAGLFSYASRSNGQIPYEEFFDLVNEVTKARGAIGRGPCDAWVQFNHKATQGMVEDITAMGLAILNPASRFIGEGSNETWNGGFQAYTDINAYEATQTPPITDDGYGAVGRFQGRVVNWARAAWIAGGGVPARFVRTIGVWFVSPEPGGQARRCCQGSLDGGFAFDAIHTAIYFSPDRREYDNWAAMEAAGDYSYIPGAVASMTDVSEVYDLRITVQDNLGWLAGMRQVAIDFGVPLYIYEFGLDCNPQNVAGRIPMAFRIASAAGMAGVHGDLLPAIEAEFVAAATAVGVPADSVRGCEYRDYGYDQFGTWGRMRDESDAANPAYVARHAYVAAGDPTPGPGGGAGPGRSFAPGGPRAVRIVAD